MATTNFQLRSNILNSFKLSGLNLRPDSAKHLEEILSGIENTSERTAWLNKIVQAVTKQQLLTSSIDQDTIETAIKECKQQVDDEQDVIFEVISAYDVPKFEFLTERKKFIERCALNLQPLNSFGSPDDKALLYNERYEIIRQRLIRHELFAPSSVACGKETQKFALRSIESFLTSSAKLDNVICLGMLTQLKEDKFYLEDPTGTIEVNLTNALFQTGLFTENSIVLLEGAVKDNVLIASRVGFPPIETAAKTRECFGNINFFGGPLKVCASSLVNLRRIESSHQTASIAFLSDVWLDSTKYFLLFWTLEKLRQLFNGFADSPPFCFVFCGNFLSKFYGNSHLSALRDAFKAIVDLLLEFPVLSSSCHFIFIPTVQEPVLTNILPKFFLFRPALPTSVLQPFLGKLSNCYLGTNPCRIQYCTQEIVVFREDIVEKMCRNCVRMPSDSATIPQHFTRSILSQSTLTPLPLHVSPVHWAFDYTLRLYPLPDLVVCADKYQPFTESMNGCIVSNPGSFAKNNYSFQLYWLARRQVDDSAVPDE